MALDLFHQVVLFTLLQDLLGASIQITLDLLFRNLNVPDCRLTVATTPLHLLPDFYLCVIPEALSYFLPLLLDLQNDIIKFYNVA